MAERETFNQTAENYSGEDHVNLAAGSRDGQVYVRLTKADGTVIACMFEPDNAKELAAAITEALRHLAL